MAGESVSTIAIPSAMSLAALKERFGAASEKVLVPLAAQCMSAAGVIKERLQPLVPYLARAFHIGFIPFVIMLGMRSEPRPKLVDLLTPM